MSAEKFRSGSSMGLLLSVALTLLCSLPSHAQTSAASGGNSAAVEHATAQPLGYAGQFVVPPSRNGVPMRTANKQLRVAAALDTPSVVVRSQAIRIDRDVLQKARQHVNKKRLAEPASQPAVRAHDDPERIDATVLSIGFFNDAVFNVVIQASERTHSGGVALVGYVPGDLASSAVIVDNDGVLAVAVYVAGKRYRIDGDTTIGYTAIEVPAIGATSIADHHDDAIEPPASIAEAAAKLAGGKSLPTTSNAADDGSIIDVMVVYTPAARIAAGGVAQMNANVDAQIAFTNLIYLNSNVVQRLRLVYKGEINLVEGDVFRDLYAIAQPSDGIADDVPLLRDVYQADVVSVWGVWPQVGGVAYANAVENQFSGAYAYSVVNAPASTQPGMTIFAHELGHTMGLMHDNYVQPGMSQVTPEGSTILTDITYAHGYVDLVNRFRTVMAYANQCYDTFSTDCTSVPFHSNPALSFDNRAAYPAASATAVMGDAVLANERRTLNDTRESVANYRPSLSSLTGPGVLAFTAPVVDVAEAAGAVSLTVARHAGSTGAVSVAYTTTPITATANLDYTTTTGTLTWASGDATTRTITVPIIQDALLEGRESFSVDLSTPTGGAVVGGFNGSGASTIVTIIDDEPDTFPAGGVFPAGYATPGASAGAWQVDTTRGYLSTASLRSAAVMGTATFAPYNQFATSDMEYTGNFATGNISFAYLLSSYAIPSGTPMSGLQFSVDGVVKLNLAGGVFDWQTFSTFITAGTHTLRWRFYNALPFPCQSRQPAGAPACFDRAWVDAISLPLVASGPQSHLAYITNSSSNTVSAIRVSNNTVVATIPVGTNPAGVAVHPDGTRVYISNSGSNSVSVIDTLTQTVIATIAVGASPLGIAINPAGTEVYVAHFGSTYIAVIDTATNTRLTDIGSANRATGIAISPNGTRAYLANVSSVQAIDLVNNVAITNTFLDNNSFGVAVSNDGSKAYIVQNQSRKVSVFNTSNNQQSFTFDVFGQPIAVAVHPFLSRLYVTSGASAGGDGTANGNSVMVFNPDTQELLANVPVGNTSYGVSVDASGAWVYVVNNGSDTVSVMDASSNTVVATIPVGSHPQSLGQFITPVSIPSAPSALAALRASGQLALSFTPPADGGTAITQYNATCQPGNIVASGTASPIVVLGLTNGVSYTCSVRATNARGVGGASPTVTATPATGTFINSAATATFTVLSASSFNVSTSGLAPTNISTSGALPAGVTLTSAGVLSGTPASGTAGSYPFTIVVANGTSTATQSFTLTVTRISQAITFAALANRSVTAPAFTVAATGGASTAPVTFASSTPSICTATGSNGATITLVAGGQCTITASQAATADYLAATSVPQSFTVRATQAITLGAAPVLLPGGTASLTATGGQSMLPVVYTSTTASVCTTSGTNGATLTGVAIGQCTVVANQAGNTNYDAAPQVTFTITLNIATQTLAFTTTPLPIGIAAPRLSAEGASGNPVELVSSTPSICTVSGVYITAIEFGSCTFTANQAGNASFSAAAPVTVSIRTATALLRQRSYHAAALLPNGKVLIAGGLHRTDGVLATAELYDPATKRWTATASLVRERMLSIAVTLQDGRVLMVGGLDSNNILVAAAEIYNPTTATWTAAGSMALGRTDHTATRLNDGRVLVAGGTPQGTVATEIYNPATNTWTAGPNMNTGRANHAAALQADDRVLVAAGWVNSNFTSSAERYDPTTNTWSAASAVATSRLDGSATLLNNGSLLLAGGATGASISERYNTATNVWSAAGTLGSRQNHTATKLNDGRVLVAGGVGVPTTTTLYDPAANIWSTTTPLLFPRINHTATVLNDGSVLIAGGNGPGGYAEIQDTAELYRAGMTLLDAVLLQSTVNTAYAPVSFSVAGGVAPYTFTLIAGALPSGMTLSTAGVLSGTPIVSGAATFTVSVTDANMLTASRQFGLTIVPPLFNVTPSAGSNGAISPAVVQPTYAGSTTTFTITPNFGYAASMGGSCGGTLVGNTYTTAVITGNCTVSASFNALFTVPDAPAIGTAVAGVSSAVVNFLASANNGGTPITLYTASCSPATVSASSTVSPITVLGLTAGVAVTCSVTATNGMGTGLASAASNSVTPIGPPRTLNASISGSGSGTITSSPTGVSCPGTCSVSFPSGTVVTLSATSTGASIFSGWLGPVCVGGNAATTCTFTITANRAVAAIFQPSVTAPGAPVGVSAVSGALSATVSFSPGPTGGSPITSYTANCYVGGNLANGATPVSGTTAPIVVTGLASGVAVNCRVTATNTAGTSVSSAASALVTPTAAPTTFTVTPSAGANGSISPSVAQTVANGATTAFTVTPNQGYSASVGGTCTGSLAGTTYTTNAITADCTVTASFAQLPGQIITFGTNPGPVGYAPNGCFTVSATGGASGNPVIFSSTTPVVCSSGGNNGATITILAVGSCLVAANQAGSANYLAAAVVTQSITINPAAQTITFPQPASPVGQLVFTVSASGGASGNAVVFTSVSPTTCSAGGVNGETVTALAAGTCTLAANQAGSATFAPAPQLTRSVQILPRITIVKSGNGAGTVISTAPSGLACGTTCVLFAASGSNVALSMLADPFHRLFSVTGVSCPSVLTAGVCTFTMPVSDVTINTSFRLSLKLDGAAPPSAYNPASDGMILLRYLLGYRGAALIAGIPSLRTASEIVAYLDARKAANDLDVDGDGATLATTDGLLITRRMLLRNVTNPAIITVGKNPAASPPLTDAEIVGRIDRLLP